MILSDLQQSPKMAQRLRSGAYHESNPDHRSSLPKPETGHPSSPRHGSGCYPAGRGGPVHLVQHGPRLRPGCRENRRQNPKRRLPLRFPKRWAEARASAHLVYLASPVCLAHTKQALQSAGEPALALALAAGEGCRPSARAAQSTASIPPLATYRSRGSTTNRSACSRVISKFV